MKKRSLTGIRASGNVHLGNYLGSIKPAVARQSDYECIYFIADMHSLTTSKDPLQIKEKTLDLVATWMACGLDINRHILFRQSDVPMVTEFAWYLSSVTGMGFLEKAHAYKDATSQSRDVNHAVFAYPVLMAADIIMYDVDIVPVGKDQKQHVEMARDMAGSFNAIYGEGLMKLPQPVIDESVMTIPGLDGRKMSKSYNNEIPLFCNEKELKKLVMSIKTDSSSLEEPKILEGTLVGELFNLFGTSSEYKDLASRLSNGGLGWGHAKDELFQVINRELKDKRSVFNDLRKDEDALRKVMNEGAQRAFTIATPVLERVREAIGFSQRPVLS